MNKKFNSDKMENNISLEDKCRAYQKACNYTIDTDKYIIAHIDGRSFSHMVKNRFEKPFDNRFVDAMNETAKYLCANVQGVQFAYVQSDEISLLIKKNNPEGDVFFGGRLCKMQSIIASLATCRFNQIMTKIEITERSYGHDWATEEILNLIDNLSLYQFDCKVWTVDNQNDAWAWFLFRNIDCARNSKQQTAQTYLSHKELMGKTTDEQIALLKEKKGVDWNILDDGVKYGRLIVKETYEIKAMNPITKTEEISERSRWINKNGYDLTQMLDKALFFDTVPCLKPEN